MSHGLDLEYQDNMATTIVLKEINLKVNGAQVTLADNSTRVPASQYVTQIRCEYHATADDGTVATAFGRIDLAAPGDRAANDFIAYADLTKNWATALAESWRSSNGVDAKLNAEISRLQSLDKVVETPPWKA